MLVIALRAFFLLVIVYIATRIMGKRELGKLQPHEFVVAVMMADLAAVPMSDTSVPILYGIIPIMVLTIVHLMITLASLKSQKMGQILCGRPTIIIHHGIVDIQEMDRLRYNFNDLMSQLREKNYFSLAEVEYAIMETSGKLSVIPKSSNKALTPQDMNLNIPQATLTYGVIVDGKIRLDDLKDAGFSRKWLETKLKDYGNPPLHDVLFASTDENGAFYIQLRNGKKT